MIGAEYLLKIYEVCGTIVTYMVPAGSGIDRS